MQDIIDFSEYQVLENKFTKQIAQEQKYVSYSNKDFALLLVQQKKIKIFI